MTLAERLAAVDAQIADAARAAGVTVPTRIVVTKFHSAQLVRDLVDLGVRDVGESRHQEAVVKVADVRDPTLNWHFVGQLQRNKARAVREYASTVHSVDRAALVDALAVEDGRTVGVFVQVDLSGEAGRGGADPGQVEFLAERILDRPGIELRGVMAVAPVGAEPRAAFARLREVSEQLRRIVPTASAISAGMSGDFREAVLEGATHLRIGTAITGKRAPAG